MPPLSTNRKQRQTQASSSKIEMEPSSPPMRESKRVRYPSLPSSPEWTPSPKSTHAGKKITFCSTLKVEDIIHVLEYTAEELTATWYDAKEIQSFKTDRRETAKRMDQGGIEDDSDCHRGVESMTISGARIRYEHILVGVNSVLDEQELQDLDETENPEMLAHIYRLNTHQCEALAYQQGLIDEREAMLLLSSSRESDSIEAVS